MSYIYEIMDRAKEQIVDNLKKVQSKYLPLWKILMKSGTNN